jgi:hypothetical protein
LSNTKIIALSAIAENQFMNQPVDTSSHFDISAMGMLSQKNQHMLFDRFSKSYFIHLVF